MKQNYAKDEIIYTLNVAGHRLSSAKYVYYFDEAIAKYPGAVSELGWILDAVSLNLCINADIYFAIVGGSASPYQVSYLKSGTFVILVDHRAFYYLLKLVFRVQSLPPICNIVEIAEIHNQKDYSGKFLLDITKDIVFKTEDTSYLITQNSHRSIYQSSLMYIIGHEIAHIAHGHLDFRNSDQFNKFCTTDSDLHLTLKTLEMDADSSATSSVFSIFERTIESMTQLLSGEEKLNKIKLIRGHYITGAYLSLIYLDTLSSNFFPTTHPDSYTRFLTTSGVFRELFLNYCQDSLHIIDYIRINIIETFIKLSGSIEYLGYPTAANIIVFDADRDPVSSYDKLGVAIGLANLDPLHYRWSQLRSYLEPFLRGGRLAPASFNVNN